ncbi:hypothetical protein JCM16303_000103 [Sporobolomyces ruberrimus]
MTTESTQWCQIDRLSRLPPELLSDIFDLAYDPNHLLLDGLSRTLYPYVRRNLYRRIHVGNPSSFRLLIDTLDETPLLVSLIVEFNLSSVPEDETLDDTIQWDVPLQDFLSLQGPKSTTSTLNDTLLVRLPFLASLSYESDIVTPNHFFRLAQLESLAKLKIRFVVFESSQFPLPKSNLSHLRELHLVGVGDPGDRWRPELARVLDWCPSLDRLILDDRVLPEYSQFLSTLTITKATLKSLILFSVPLDDDDDIAPCDYLLPQFFNLEHLDLADGTITSKLPTHLRKLTKLSSLRLGQDTHCDGPSTEDIIDLVRGPDRIETLEALVIDSFEGKIGERYDIDHCSGVGPLEWRLLATGWRYNRFPGLSSSRQAVLELIDAGRKSEVSVSGSILEMAKVLTAADLELANRLILRAHNTRSLDEYINARAAGTYRRLPDLDVNKLNLDNLKLVKADLPEEGWFQFTLE